MSEKNLLENQNLKPIKPEEPQIEEIEEPLALPSKEMQRKLEHLDYLISYIQYLGYYDGDETSLPWEAVVDDMKDYMEELENSKDFVKAAFSDKSSVRDVYKMLVDLSYYQAREDFKIQEDCDVYHKKLAKWGLNIIEELMPEIEIMSKLRFSISETEGLNLYDNLANNGNEIQQKKGISALAGRLDFIEKGIRDKDQQIFHRNLRYLKEILKKGDEKESGSAEELIKRIVNEQSESDQRSVYLISTLFEVEHLKQGIYGLRLVNKQLEKLGLPAGEIIKAWLDSTHFNKLPDAVWDNLIRITQLESRKSGICRFLFNEFGIADFGRYPVELLLKQKEQFNDRSKPYGVVLYPRDDWNGAFYNFPMLEKFYKQLKGEFYLRVFECKSKLGVVKALNKLNKLYNPPDDSGHKISLAIIGGHGTKNSINFGGRAWDNKEGGKKEELHINDLKGSVAEESGKFFIKYPTIILESCSTGADEGIGKELAKVLGAKVIAPTTPNSVQELYAVKKPGRDFRFNVKYGESKEKAEYFEGEKLR